MYNEHISCVPLLTFSSNKSTSSRSNISSSSSSSSSSSPSTPSSEVLWACRNVVSEMEERFFNKCYTANDFFPLKPFFSTREKLSPYLPTLPGWLMWTLSRVSLLILGEERFQGENLDRTLVCPLGISFLLKQRRFLFSRMWLAVLPLQ